MKLNNVLLTGFSLFAGISLFATPAEDMLAAAEKTEAGLVAMAEKGNHTTDKYGKKVLDPVVYEALLLAFKDSKPHKDHYQLFDVPYNAIRTLKKNYRLPDTDEMLPRLLTNASPNVRAVALTTVNSIKGSEEKQKIIKDLLKNETDPVVITALIRAFTTQAANDPDVAAFLLKSLDNQDEIVRKIAVMQSCITKNRQVEGLAAKIASIIQNEKSELVKSIAYQYAPMLNNDVIVDAFAKAIYDDSNPKMQNDAIAGLIKCWWSFPMHNTDRQKAYDLTLKYLKEVKPNNNVPGITAFFPLTSRSGDPSQPKSAFGKWLATATWYKPEDVAAVILPYASDKDYPRFVRSTAFKVLAMNGYTKEQLTGIIEQLKAVPNLLSKFEVNELENIVKKMK